MNDYKGIFCPILNLNLFKINYQAENMDSTFSMKFSSMYHNPVASTWEPLIEPSKILLNMNSSSLKVNFPEKLNINISKTFISVLATTLKSWNETDKQQTNISKDSRRGVYDGSGISPFSIKNESGIYIRLSKIDSKQIDSQESVIPNGVTIGITVDYEQTIENMVNNSKGKKESSKNIIHNNVKITDNIFNVEFDSELNYRPIKGLNFNEVSSGVHNLCEIGRAHV